MNETSKALAAQILHDVKIIMLDMPEYELEKVEMDRGYSSFDTHTLRVKFKNGDTLWLSLTTKKEPK